MEPIKKEITPDDEWLLSLNASCNRLSNQYLNLLKSASSIAALHNINNYFDETTTTTTATIGAAAGVDSSSTNANGPVILSSATTAAAVIAGGGVGSGINTTASGNSSSGNVTHQHDPRAGGGYMTQNDMVAPPPLAADVAIHATVQCQLCIENICVATSQILNLIRTLRLSLLLMDNETISAEEHIQVQETQQLTADANRAAIELEYQYIELLKKQLE